MFVTRSLKIGPIVKYVLNTHCYCEHCTRNVSVRTLVVASETCRHKTHRIWACWASICSSTSKLDINTFHAPTRSYLYSYKTAHNIWEYNAEPPLAITLHDGKETSRSRISRRHMRTRPFANKFDNINDRLGLSICRQRISWITHMCA